MKMMSSLQKEFHTENLNQPQIPLFIKKLFFVIHHQNFHDSSLSEDLVTILMT